MINAPAAGPAAAAFMRDARIGQQRDIGERENIADQEARVRKTTLHVVKRDIAALHQIQIQFARGLAEIDHLKAAHGHIGLMAVLLPEQPGVHLRGGKGVDGNEIAAAGEIPDDRIGLRERTAVVEFDRGHLPPRVELEKLGRAAAALGGVDVDPCGGQRQRAAHPFHLQAVARIAVTVNSDHRAALGRRRHRTSRVSSCQAKRRRSEFGAHQNL